MKILITGYVYLISAILCNGITAQTTIKDFEPGNLMNIITQKQQDTCTALKVIGKINSADIKVLRKMAGCPENGNQKGKLRTLDLLHAEIVTDKEPYMELNSEDDSIYISSYVNSPKGSTHTINKNTWYHSNGTTHFSRFNDWSFATPIYIIGIDEEKYNQLQKNEYPYLLTNAISKKDMKRIKRKGLLKLKKGHAVKWKNNKFYLQFSTHNKTFSLSTFYQCPQLETVFLPVDIKINNQIRIYKDEVQYFLCKEGKITNLIKDGRIRKVTQ